MLIRWMVSAGETMMDSTGSNVGDWQQNEVDGKEKRP